MNCEYCDKYGYICLIRKGRATYYCADHMNIERDKGVQRGDMWLTTKPENA